MVAVMYDDLVVQAPQGILLNFFADNIRKSARYYVNDFFKMLPEE